MTMAPTRSTSPAEIEPPNRSPHPDGPGADAGPTADTRDPRDPRDTAAPGHDDAPRAGLRGGRTWRPTPRLRWTRTAGRLRAAGAVAAQPGRVRGQIIGLPLRLPFGFHPFLVVFDLALDPAFVPADAESNVRLARRASQLGHAQLALRLVNGFHKRHPKSADIPEMYLLAARLLSERMGKDAEAKALLTQIRTAYPNHALVPQIDALLALIESVSGAKKPAAT